VAINTKATVFGQPVPELQVTDVVRAQAYYRDVLGFGIGWLEPGHDMGAVSRDNAVLFLRRKTPPIQPAVHWVFTDQLDARYLELKGNGASIADPPEKKPWGLIQFTLCDPDGNLFHFHN
jgi:uncharacterized glyoxalase superfamily protein PhnB